MPLTYAYADAYLKSQITEEREIRAIEDIERLGIMFSDEWMQRLVILRAYIIACLECQAQPDDLFAQKLKHYKAEYETTLATAQSAAATTAGSTAPIFSIPIERA